MDRRAQLQRKIVWQVVILILLVFAPNVIRLMASSLDSGSSDKANLEEVLLTVQSFGLVIFTVLIVVSFYRMFQIVLTGGGDQAARAAAYESYTQRLAEEAQPDLADSLESMLASNEGTSESSTSRTVREQGPSSYQEEDKSVQAVPDDAVMRVIREGEYESNSSEDVVKEDPDIKRIIRSSVVET
ncbi:hypothetical protein [Paenibacillus campinasensis]|uniref:Uncharacterized protein n=1 Tax=Paenibacillus campinasensis TaxID=66347 RepID=A0A268EIC0_9BACL|nr:hypothetical protein [Paenibacillus campinasensis]PAD72871.1 hypothetical protein CHH67_21435 [Paenibacillus campinasensis]